MFHLCNDHGLVNLSNRLYDKCEIFYTEGIKVKSAVNVTFRIGHTV